MAFDDSTTPQWARERREKPRCPRCGSVLDFGGGRLIPICSSFACALQECGGDRVKACRLYYERSQLPPDTDESEFKGGKSGKRKPTQRGGGLIH